jgi:steroid delta-isomerase-like uncharacterized protein
MSVEAHIERIRTIIRQLNGGDIDSTAVHVTEGFSRHDLSGNFLAGRSGGGEVTDFLHTLYASIPDLQIEIEDIFGSDDKVTVRYGFTGTHQGPLLGVAGTAKPLRFSGVNIYRFEDGKIAEAWQLWDWATVLEQMGAIER